MPKTRVRVATSALTALSSLVFLVVPTHAWMPTSDHPWPMFMGNYNHTGYVDVKGPRDGTLKWKYKAASGDPNAAPPNSVAVGSNGVIYVGAPAKVVALKPDGTVKWKKGYTNVQGPALSPDGKTVYISGNNKLIALKAKNGEKKWVYKMGDSTLFGPTIGPDGTIYQGSWDKNLYAMNPDGSLKWTYTVEGALSYPVSMNEKGTIFVGAGDAHAGEDGNVYALKKDGTLKWTFDTSSSRAGTPAMTEDGLILVAAAPALYALNKSGELEWSVGEPGGDGDGDDDEVIGEPPPGTTATGDVAGIITPGVGPDGTIYIGNSDGLITALNGETQETLWTYQTGADPEDSTHYGMPSFPVVDKKGAVYMGSVDHNMYALDKDGNVLWIYETEGEITEAAPALGADGTLYFTSYDGYLYAIQDE